MRSTQRDQFGFHDDDEHCRTHPRRRLRCSHDDASFAQALKTFFDMLAQTEMQELQTPPSGWLPAELENLDQLKVLLDALPDYDPEDTQPSFVLAIPVRPILVGLSAVLPGSPALANCNWSSIMAHSTDGAAELVVFPPTVPAAPGSLLPPPT